MIPKCHTRGCLSTVQKCCPGNSRNAAHSNRRREDSACHVERHVALRGCVQYHVV